MNVINSEIEARAAKNCKRCTSLGYAMCLCVYREEFKEKNRGRFGNYEDENLIIEPITPFELFRFGIPEEWKNVAIGLEWEPESIMLLVRSKVKEMPRAIGYVYFTMVAGVVRINEILVSEQVRRSGIGHLLLAEVERYANSRSCHKISLVTTEWHVGALDFYKKNGFVVESIHPNDRGHLTWFTMVKIMGRN